MAAAASRWSTRQLVTMALLCAISVILSFIEFPFIAVSFLKYDASMVPILLGGYAFGPAAGVIIGTVSWLIHALINGDIYGALMNIIVVCCYVIPAAALWCRDRSNKMLIIGLVIAIVLHLVGAIAGDLLIVPIYMNTTVEVVMSMLIPVFLPFNLIKAVLNSVLGVACVKAILPLIEKKGAAK